MATDFYNTLGVEKSASADEIKRAYRKLAMQHHPDKGGNQEKFKEINEAYQILSDPQKRAQYDQFGSAGAQGGSPFGGGFSGFQGGQADGFEFNFGSFGGLGDIFGDFFSQAFATVQAEVQISPAQAAVGDHLVVDVGGEKIDFEIPAGTQEGTQLRFQGKGRRANGGQRGDLILSVKIKVPHRLSKEQKELYEKLKDLEGKKHSWWK